MEEIKNMKMNLKKIAKWSLVLFSVMLVCFIGDCPKAQAATKAQYTYKTYDKSKTYKGKKSTIKDVEKYKRVILKGDSEAVKKINQVLEEVCDAAVKEMPTGSAEYAAEHLSYDDEYRNVYTSRVTYNANGVISIMISYEWYQGGVLDYGCDGYTFDLATGEQLKLTDVCNGSDRTLMKKIKNKLIRKYSIDAFSQSSVDELSADKCDFYLNKGGKAVVVFDKYEIAAGAAGAFDVTLNSKYYGK